ncbi:unnamed protein product [Orchesella dallaii]|uniref:Non-structural maintenance of chromosomes element 4 n=1 Tax=Orchesella dallaii TaxID=48710 RepID=A0ABP1PVT7_9HEXA
MLRRGSSPTPNAVNGSERELETDGGTWPSNEQNISSNRSSLDLLRDSYMDMDEMEVTETDDRNSDAAMDISSDNGRGLDGDRPIVLDDEESEASNVSEELEDDEVENEAEFEDEKVMTAPDITCAPPIEVKQIYTDLIETCKNFEEGLTLESENILKKNIFTGHSLFQQIESTLTESVSEIQLDETQNITYGKTASEVLLACNHTKICAEMLKQKVKTVGAVASPFSIEDFLGSLKKDATDQNGAYSVSKAVKNLAYTASTVSHTVPKFIYVFGALDRGDMEAAKVPEPPVVKAKKVRVRPQGYSSATRSEIVNDKMTAARSEDLNSDAPEELARDVLKSLKTKYRLENGTPQSILDVSYGGNNPSDFISRTFGMAFAVQDGRVEVSPSGNPTTGRETSASLMLKPIAKVSSTPINKDERQQTIVSYSAKFIRELLQSQSNGENN